VPARREQPLGTGESGTASAPRAASSSPCWTSSNSCKPTTPVCVDEHRNAFAREHPDCRRFPCCPAFEWRVGVTYDLAAARPWSTYPPPRLRYLSPFQSEGLVPPPAPQAPGPQALSKVNLLSSSATLAQRVPSTDCAGLVPNAVGEWTWLPVQWPLQMGVAGGREQAIDGANHGSVYCSGCQPPWQV
jgi:hypothetical protein